MGLPVKRRAAVGVILGVEYYGTLPHLRQAVLAHVPCHLGHLTSIVQKPQEAEQEALGFLQLYCLPPQL